MNADEVSMLAAALLVALQTYLEPDSSERSLSLVELLEEFCSLRECIRPLSAELLSGLLGELLRQLQCNWAKTEDGKALQRKVNLACVMLLNAIPRPSAYGLLLNISLRGDFGSLVLKCIRKINKGLAGCKNPETEASEILDVLDGFATDLRSESRNIGAPDATQGVREIVDALLSACPSAAASWASTRQHGGAACPEDVLAILGLGDEGEKENIRRGGRTDEAKGPSCAEPTGSPVQKESLRADASLVGGHRR